MFRLKRISQSNRNGLEEQTNTDGSVAIVTVTISYSKSLEEITVWLETTPGEHVIRWCKQKGYKEPILATTPIEDKKVKEIITLLTDSCIPPLIEPAIGVDGYTVKVSVGNNWGGANYYWWCSVPAGWEPLGKVVEILLEHVRSGRYSFFKRGLILPR